MKKFINLKLTCIFSQISKQKVDRLAIKPPEGDTHSKSNDDTAVENFPICCLYGNDKMPSPCRLAIKGLHVTGQESSEYDIASLSTVTDSKFQVHDDDSQDSHVDKISMFHL